MAVEAAEVMGVRKGTKNMIQNLYGLGDYGTNQVRAMATEVEREGLDPAPIYYRRPDASAEPKAFVKAMPLPEIPYIIPDAFAGTLGADLVQALSLSQLQEIGTEGEEYLKGAIKIALEAAVQKSPADEHLKELKRYVDLSPAWQV